MSDPEKVMEMLDFMTEAGVSRIKVEMSDAVEEGTYRKAYHHGRCDVGSPFATGKLYDLEDPEERTAGSFAPPTARPEAGD